MLRLCIEASPNITLDFTHELLFKLSYEWNVSVVRTGY